MDIASVHVFFLPVIYHDTSRSHCTLNGHHHWSPTQMVWQCPFKKAAFPCLLTAKHPALFPYQLLVLMTKCLTLEFINSLTSSMTNVHSLSSNALFGLESFKKFSRDKFQLFSHSSIPEYTSLFYYALIIVNEVALSEKRALTRGKERALIKGFPSDKDLCPNYQICYFLSVQQSHFQRSVKTSKVFFP